MRLPAALTPTRFLLLASVLAGCAQDPSAPATVVEPGPVETAPGETAPAGPAPGAPGPGPGPVDPPPDARLPSLDTAADPAPAFPPVAADADGMVRVDGGWIQLGSRLVAPVPGVTLPPPAPPPGAAGEGAPAQGAAASAEGGAARAAGGPPVAGPRPGGASVLPVRRVRVEPFRIDRTEVTRGQYARFLSATGYRLPHVHEGWAEEGWNWTSTTPPAGTEDHPVVLVSWYDASEYCAWAGKRLPTEAEWQLAALGPDDPDRIFPWGDAWSDARVNHGTIAPPNFDDSDGYRETSPVGAFPAGRSAAGLEDAFGNAWEFTADARVASWADYRSRPQGDGLADVHAPMPALYVAVRGGSYFFDFRVNPAGERHAFLPEIRRKTSGFRCAAALP